MFLICYVSIVSYISLKNKYSTANMYMKLPPNDNIHSF